MRCYRARGKGVGGLYQKVTEQGRGETTPHLSLLEDNSLCWMQLQYMLHNHGHPGAPQPREVHSENLKGFPSLVSEVFPPWHCRDHSPATSAYGHSSVSGCKTERFWWHVHSKLISRWEVIPLLSCYAKLTLSSWLQESTYVGRSHWAQSCQ